MGAARSQFESQKQAHLPSFVGALERELASEQRLVRVFDVGGSGVKTALVKASALQRFLKGDADAETAGGSASQEVASRELQWVEPPSLLGRAPGQAGFSSWLLEAVPSLGRELSDEHVCFGVSVGGDVHHASGVLREWWPGGGHPQLLAGLHPKPRVADLMGLPSGRAFVLHDGEAHLLGCSRGLVPSPGLACLAIGTGVGLGLSDASGAVVDPSAGPGMGSFYVNGAPLSGAPYRGIWQQWLEGPAGSSTRVREVMAKEFATCKAPWRQPWVSLVLGRRGMELAEAAHGCPEPDDSKSCADDAQARAPAARAYGEQWLHFLRTQFVPQMCAERRRHPVTRLCFAGGLVDRNWPALHEILTETGSGTLRTLPKGGSATRVEILPPAPSGSALIGAAIYALAGVGGGSAGIWTT